MNSLEELARVEEIKKKLREGRKLTSQEQRIYSYSVYGTASHCRCGKHTKGGSMDGLKTEGWGTG